MTDFEEEIKEMLDNAIDNGHYLRAPLDYGEIAFDLWLSRTGDECSAEIYPIVKKYFQGKL